MPETYAEWKALAERLDAQQHHFDGVITQQNSVRPVPPTTNHPPFPQTCFALAALPRAPHPFLAQPLARTPAPPSMPCPTNAGDAMVVDHACAPGVVRTCFRCGQAGHMVRECPLLDTRPQIPRLQVCAVESQGRSFEDYENEIALLRDCLELYERERERLLLRSRILETRPSESELV